MKRVRTIIICAGLALLYALPLFTLPAFSAAYMKFDGVDGESLGEDQTDATGQVVKAHKNEIDVLAWSWGTSDGGSSATGGGQGGRECIQDVSFTKYIDKASPKLMLSCLNGKQIAEATLAITEPDGAGAQVTYDYFTVRMIDVVVRSVANAGEANAPDRPVESFSLNFTKIEMKYTENDSKGATTEMKWDLESNSEYK